MSDPGLGTPGYNPEEEVNAQEASKPTERMTLEEMSRYITSVTEIVSGMNSEGLVSKNSEGSGLQKICDYPSGFQLGHLAHELFTPYADYAYRTGERQEDKERANEMLGNFNGQIVVDLGAGDNPHGYLIARTNGARAYIGVELYQPEMLVKSIMEQIAANEPELGQGLESPFYTSPIKRDSDRAEKYHANPTIKLAIVAEDMLNFLRRLPESSVSIFCSGIDAVVLSNDREEQTGDARYGEYYRSVGAEIARVLNPDGAYIGVSDKFIRLPQTNQLTQRVLSIGDSPIAWDNELILTEYKKEMPKSESI